MKTTFVVLFFFSVFFNACSSLQKWQRDAAAKRDFSIQKVWIQPTSRNEIVGFRKINRMRPLLYSKNNKNWIIQVNAFDGIAAYDRSSGREAWRTNIPNGAEASVAIVNDRLFFGGNDGVFYSLDATTGS